MTGAYISETDGWVGGWVGTWRPVTGWLNRDPSCLLFSVAKLAFFRVAILDLGSFHKYCLRTNTSTEVKELRRIVIEKFTSLEKKNKTHQVVKSKFQFPSQLINYKLRWLRVTIA